jgi:hypothetical protein
VKLAITPFEDTVYLLWKDVKTVRAATEHTTPIHELRIADTALHSLAEKLSTLRCFLPKTNKKRVDKSWWINSEDIIWYCHNVRCT